MLRNYTDVCPSFRTDYSAGSRIPLGLWATLFSDSVIQNACDKRYVPKNRPYFYALLRGIEPVRHVLHSSSVADDRHIWVALGVEARQIARLST
jgi:hypothetical protein